MNRRSLLSTLCTGALALLAPLAAPLKAWAGKRPSADVRERPEPFRVHLGDVSALTLRAEAAEADWQAAEDEARGLRGLLAEARDAIRNDPSPCLEEYYHVYRDLLPRIDAALK